MCIYIYIYMYIYTYILFILYVCVFYTCPSLSIYSGGPPHRNSGAAGAPVAAARCRMPNYRGVVLCSRAFAETSCGCSQTSSAVRKQCTTHLGVVKFCGNTYIKNIHINIHINIPEYTYKYKHTKI